MLQGFFTEHGNPEVDLYEGKFSIIDFQEDAFAKLDDKVISGSEIIP